MSAEADWRYISQLLQSVEQSSVLSIETEIRMIDSQGFRPNVGIMIANDEGRLLWARRVGGRDAWQFPQGGIRRDEKPEQALYRELMEEVGLGQEQVELVASTKGWLRYRLPKQYQRRGQKPLCVGQKQKWFLLQMRAADSAIRLDEHVKPEFDHWQWVSYWYPLNQVVYFKRDVYRRALRELAEPLAKMTSVRATD